MLYIAVFEIIANLNLYITKKFMLIVSHSWKVSSGNFFVMLDQRYENQRNSKNNSIC